MADGDLFLLLEADRPPVSPIAERAYQLMRPLAKHDRADDWPLLQLLDVLTRGEGPIWELVEDPGMGDVLDVDVAPAAWLPFLAAVVGGRLTAAMTEAQRRLEIANPSGYRRGLATTMRAFVDGLLTGQRVIVFRERDGSPRHLTVRTRLSETPDPDAVLAALLANKPAHHTIDYLAIDERDWEEVAETWATWDDVAGANATWDDVNIP